jgi:hypothetical protein
MSNFPWADTPAVVITSTRDDVVAGINPWIETDAEDGTLVSWGEGGHVRTFVVDRILVDDGAVFSFDDRRGYRHVLEPMTLALYRERVRSKTVGQPDFQSLEELIAAMRFDW